MGRNGRLVLIFLLAISLLAVGCQGGAVEGTGEKILRQNSSSGEPSSLDPAKAFDEDSMDVVGSLFEGLMRLNAQHQPEPAVAEKVDVSSDGRTYTFHLRDTRWSNGEKVTAHDFEYAWKRVLNPQTASEAAFLMYFIENAEAYNTGKATADQVGVKATDDRTLVVKLSQPTPFFKQLTCYPVYSPVYKKGLEKNPNLYNEAASYVSNGPFKMKTWKHDQKIEVVKNKHYRLADQVKLDGISWTMVTEQKTAYQMYQSGQLDMLSRKSVPADILAGLIKKGDAKVNPGSGLEFFRFNVTKPPFHNAKIRKAFALAVDRTAIVKQVVQGNEQPAGAFVSPGTLSQTGDFRKAASPFVPLTAQPAQAKRLLQEGMKEEGWKTLPPVTLLYNSNEKNKAVAEALQAMFKQNLGVDVRLQSQETKVFLSNQKAKNYQLSRSSFLPDYNDPYNYLESFQTDHPMNRTGWSNPQYDALVKKAFSEPDDTKRLEYLHQAEKILFDEMPIFPLYYYNQVHVQKDYVKNIIRHPVGPSDYRFTVLDK